jgi:predicted nuclease of predicted toxin-antitoxin system
VPSHIRFFLDEHVPSAVAAGLARRGIDVLTVREAERRGFGDAEQLQFATENKRVIVTFDRDFLVLSDQGLQHAGIVFCEATKYSIGQMIQSLLLVQAVLTAEDMQNHVEYL